MALFVLSDPHLSFSTNKPMDVFGARWENHAEKLDAAWREIVSENDTVVIPGDVSWAMTLDEAVEDFSFINSLPGKKIILKGNHDYWWQSMKNSASRYRMSRRRKGTRLTADVRLRFSYACLKNRRNAFDLIHIHLWRWLTGLL